MTFPAQKKELLLSLLVASVALLVYANSLGNGFALDDFSVIVNNPAFTGKALDLFKIIDTVDDTQLLPYYRPLTYLSFFAERQLHGFNPFYIRLFNVLLHAANAVLVFRLARALFRDNLPAALLVGLLFAVHPVHTEGVDFNAGGRNTMLACFFAIAAYLTHRRGLQRARSSIAGAGALLFFAGLLSKESALMILPLIAALEVSSLRSTGLAGAWRQSCIRLAPYLVATGCYLVMRGATLAKFGIQSGLLPELGSRLLESRYVTDDLATRLLHNLYIIPRYLLTIVNPTALSPRYDIPDDLNLLALPLAAAWIFMGIGLGWLCTRGRSPATLFGLAWLVLFWVPVSGITIIPIPLADRYFYLPAIGCWIIVADQLFRFLPANSRTARNPVLVAVAVLLCLLAGLTVKRNLDWKNDLTLFTRFVAQYPDSHHAHFGLGNAHARQTDEQSLALAESELEKALALYAMNRIAHRQLGNLKLNRGDLQSALAHYNEAIAMFPQDREARINRAITYEKLGRENDARSDYQFYLTIPGAETLPQARSRAEERLRALSR